MKLQNIQEVEEFRKVVHQNADKKKGEVKETVVTAENLADFLGVRRFTYGVAQKEPQVGQVNGLAWTEAGGDILSVEAVVFPGKGIVQRTGSLGDVMKESVEAARSVVRARAAKLGIEAKAFGETDWHIHFPEGATPKDGPSAGAAITTAIVSAMTNIPVRPDVAMTGEITLRGEVLEIGGLKEKLLAALELGARAEQKIDLAFNYAERLFDQDQKNTEHQAMSQKMYGVMTDYQSRTAFVVPEILAADKCQIAQICHRIRNGERLQCGTVLEHISRQRFQCFRQGEVGGIDEISHSHAPFSTKRSRSAPVETNWIS